MHQPGFFDNDVQQLELKGADIILHRNFLPSSEADIYFEKVNSDTPWKQEEILMFGKFVPLPRLTAWFGDRGKSYTYSGIRLEPLPWTPVLSDLREKLEVLTNCNLNSLLANLYRDGNDSVAWHSDDEPELGKEPTIVSVSLGASRRFRLKQKNIPPPVETCSLDLHHGDVLIMSGQTQQNWFHELTRTSRTVAPRINLTFRNISDDI